MAVEGDYLADLKAIAEELNIAFECYDSITPEEIEGGTLP
jgi:L-fucose isomerase